MIVGGCDVDQRLELMTALSRDFAFAAAGSRPELKSKFLDAGFPFFHYPLVRGANPLHDLHSLRVLRTVIGQWRPQIVHAFATKPCVWGRLAARVEGVPVIVGTLPGLGSLYSSNGLRVRLVRSLYCRLQKLACNHSDVTVFQNRRDVTECLARGLVASRRWALIRGSGVRTDVFDRKRVPTPLVQSVRDQLDARGRMLVVTMVSRVIRSKGVLEFCEAARLLRSRFSNVRFLLVGPHDHDSVDRLTLEELRRVSGSVTWWGKRHDILEILAASDVFVLPSFYREGVPRVLLEAASMGLPLVATGTRGCEEIVKDGFNGLLVRPRDPASLAAAIATLIERPLLRQRFSSASRQLVIRDFDVTVVARQTGYLYRRLLARRVAAADTAFIARYTGSKSIPWDRPASSS